MNRPLYQKYVLMALISLMAASVYFVTVTSAGLPPTVASHFNAAGVANGFMSKNNYTFSMLAISVGIPSFLVLMSLGLTKVPVSLINIPHREYWLSPERHAETIKIITGFMLFLACILVVFLSFVHWLVTLANAQQPPEMSGFSIYVGLIILLMLIGVWSLFLIRAFHLDDHQEK